MTPLFELQGVTKTFARPEDAVARLRARLAGQPAARRVTVLHETDLAVAPGEVLGLVGESGCGKSTLGRVAAGLHAPDTGRRLWDGADVAAMPPAQERATALGIQMIFQDPHASLNPRRRVGDAIGEAAGVHGLLEGASQADFAAELLRQVGLDPAMADRFPHQFSGGQRARIGIARALAVQPRFLVCDESVAALDVSVQAQVLNLFMDLRERKGLTYLFISHDLSVVHHLADRVAVMYLGRLVEVAPTAELFREPAHPYTRALLDSVPRLDAGNTVFQPLKGEIASPLAPPSGCAFHPRCPHAMAVCREQQPALQPVAAGRFAACHLVPACGTVPSTDSQSAP
ncbi:ATP-binding cassette domain-containing protein [Ramlibacter sp. G-1-2-2]|uniref:ATP-binding cassette domain-containing protein n=1 Tax=Ramlibacter agri TaxID=2728837 RepID=A0A848HC62_9BURK|nr:oligopeptide/dipeptide ABC transporter ATP-binding protein [Ramlibacter agri]NML47079.1 ATP-binding cassette domain-containing protein [Ramlibacter agri]